MAKIENIIGQSAVEQIRDRIALILGVEFLQQSVLCAAHDPVIPFDLPSIFTERYVSIDQQEGSVIVVRVNDGQYSNKDQKDVTGDYQFFIDCYSYSEQVGVVEAYYLSSVKMERLMMLVRAILQDQSYRTLDFLPPGRGGGLNVKATNVSMIKVGTRTDMPDSLAETCGRVFFSVEVAESVENKDTVALAGSYNKFYMGVTDKGYQVIETT